MKNEELNPYFNFKKYREQFWKPDNSIGRLFRMEAIKSKSINEAALENSKQTLSKMERALTMIDDPDFGLCCECEESIPFARLMIMPESDLCVKCAEAIEG